MLHTASFQSNNHPKNQSSSSSGTSSMEVHVVSELWIKPSVPTPRHLRNYNLSCLDQLAHACVPLIFFYPNNDPEHDILRIIRRLQRLKRSLADILPHFYPLAGKIKDSISVDCCDDGVYFVNAQVNCHLCDFLSQQLDVQSLNKFLPLEPAVEIATAGIPVASIQVNVFKCGGMAIAICLSHKVLDGAGHSSFMKTWAGRSRDSSEEEPVSPNYSAAAGSSLFPAAGDLLRKASSEVLIDTLFKKGKFTKRRFLFDASSISKLRARAVNSGGRFPTRVETVSTFIWKSATAASEQLHGYSRFSRSRHVVNLRSKLVPPVSDNVFGNLYWVVETNSTTAKQELNELVKEIRDAKAKIDDKFLGELRGDEGCSMLSAAPEEMSSPSTIVQDVYSFSSLCNLGLYDSDFGWGKPVWVSMSSKEINAAEFFNITVLMETRQGDGIEAWVTLDEPQMNIFCQDQELLKFASPDPSFTLAGNFVSLPRKKNSSPTHEKTLHDSQSWKIVSRI